MQADLLSGYDESGAIGLLTHNVPFVAMIDLASLDSSLPPWSWHFVVPLALNQGEVTYHDPVAGPDRRANLDEFLAAWGMAAYLGVHVWTP